MNKYKSMMFFSPDEGGGGETGGGAGESIPGSGGEISRGTTAFEPVPKITTGDKPLPTKSKEHAEGVRGGEGVPHSGESGVVHSEGEQPVAQPGGFDASKFAKEFGDTLGTTLKPILERVEPEAQMTPEEARKILNVWEPDEQWYAQYDNLETRADAVQAMRDGLVRQADTIAQFRMREMIDALKQEVMPHIQSATQTANQQREERFKTSYPQLKEPAMQPLIKAIAQDLVDRQQTFQSETDLFKALANGVEAVLKVNNPEFKLETASNGSQNETTGRSSRSLPVTTPGGGGGAGRREGGSKPEKPKGMAIFDKI